MLAGGGGGFLFSETFLNSYPPETMLGLKISSYLCPQELESLRGSTGQITRPTPPSLHEQVG